MASDFATRRAHVFAQPVLVFKSDFSFMPAHLAEGEGERNFKYRVAQVARNVAWKMKTHEGDTSEENPRFIFFLRSDERKIMRHLRVESTTFST